MRLYCAASKLDIIANLEKIGVKLQSSDYDISRLFLIKPRDEITFVKSIKSNSLVEKYCNLVDISQHDDSTNGSCSTPSYSRTGHYRLEQL